MRALLLPLALLAACTPKPPVTEVTSSEVPPGVALDPERARYQRLLDECERRRRVLTREVETAQRRQQREAGVAYAATQIASRRDGDANTAPGNPQAAPGAPCPGNDAEVTPCPSPVPIVAGSDPHSPRARATDAVHGDAEREVEAINERIAAADEFLFSHADPRAWTDEEQITWEGLLANLALACDVRR